jgi:hypothetical protein
VKLLFCPACQDVIKFGTREKGKRYCACGASYGYYLDSVNAVVGGKGVPLGFANSSLAHALINRPEEGNGRKFEAFVIPKECPTIEVEDGKGG